MIGRFDLSEIPRSLVGGGEKDMRDNLYMP